jgi:hypothetical protein
MMRMMVETEDARPASTAGFDGPRSVTVAVRSPESMPLFAMFSVSVFDDWPEEKAISPVAGVSSFSDDVTS